MLAQRQGVPPPDMLSVKQFKTPGCWAGGLFAEDTTMQRTKPPFRADHVGSILRTAPIKQARVQREKGAITAAQLKEVEDREI